MKTKLLLITSLALLVSACGSSDDNSENSGKGFTEVRVSQAPSWALDWSYNQERPDWVEPNSSDYEFWSVMLVQLEGALRPYASADDLMAVFVGNELRGLAKPAISVDSDSTAANFFLIKAYTNEGDKTMIDVTLKYYCSKLQHIFSRSATIENKVEEVTGVDEDFIPQLTLGPAKYPVVMTLPLSSTPLTVASFHTAQSGMVAAFVGDECRGVTSLPATTMTVYGREAGEALTFKYYDATNTRVLTFNQTLSISNS